MTENVQTLQEMIAKLEEAELAVSSFTREKLNRLRYVCLNSILAQLRTKIKVTKL
jgi:hypothetical protein